MRTKQDFTYQAVEIKPGIRLHAVQTGQFKTASLILQFAVPLRLETGCVYSLLTDVLSCGCERYPTMQDLNRAQDELYSLELNITSTYLGEMQMITFDISCIEDAFTLEGRPLLMEGIELLKEVLFRPLLANGYFRPDYVEREKKNLSDLILSRINDKDRLARLRCILHMCGNEPFSVPARTTADMVAQITPERLMDAYRHLLEEAPVGIVYAGRKTASEVASLLSGFPLPPRGEFRLTASAPVLPSEVKTVREQADVNQCKLVMGYRIAGMENIRQRTAFLLFHDLFGGSSVSRLFTRVREQQGLCYDCSGLPNLHKGVYFVAGGTRTEQADRLIRSVEAERAELADGRFTEEELDRSKKTLIRGIREAADSPATYGTIHLRNAMRGEFYSIEERIRIAEEIRPDEVVQAARRMIPDTFYLLEGRSHE